MLHGSRDYIPTHNLHGPKLLQGWRDFVSTHSLKRPKLLHGSMYLISTHSLYGTQVVTGFQRLTNQPTFSRESEDQSPSLLFLLNSLIGFSNVCLLSLLLTFLSQLPCPYVFFLLLILQGFFILILTSLPSIISHNFQYHLFLAKVFQCWACVLSFATHLI